MIISFNEGNLPQRQNTTYSSIKFIAESKFGTNFMGKQIGIISDVSIARNLINLKNSALMFDKIAIIATPEGKVDRNTSNRKLYEDIDFELDKLSKYDFISIIDDESDKFAFGDSLSIDEDQYLSYVQWLRKLEIIPSFSEQKPLPTFESRQDELMASYRKSLTGVIALSSESSLENIYRSLGDFVSRFASSRLQNENNYYIPIVFGKEYDLKHFGANIENPFSLDIDNKYNLVTLNLCNETYFPDSNANWDDIFHFRSEIENKASFLGMRKFLKEISSQRKDISDISAEIDLNRSIVEIALKKSKLTYRKSIINTTVVIPLNIVENIIKLKFSAAAKNLVQILEEKEKILESEAKIATNGMYYIVKAQNQFERL